jgi:hypothetical protein
MQFDAFDALTRQGKPDSKNDPGFCKKMPRRRTGRSTNRDRHLPNTPGGYYRSKADQKLKPFHVELKPETVAAWKEAAIRAGMNQRQAAESALRAFARQHGVEVPEHPGPNGSKPPKPDFC